MTQAQKDLNELEDASKKLNDLLTRREEGLLTWWMLVQEQTVRIAKIAESSGMLGSREK